MIPWFKNVIPHKDIQDGVLDEAVFAANLGDVALGKGREIYANSKMFFNKTYFTSGLKTVTERVIKGLNGEADAGDRVISLQTGFGGGKTHTLISLYHVIKEGKKLESAVDIDVLKKFVKNIKFDKANVAVFTNTTNDPTQGREVKGLHIRTLWGEIAYQLGGADAYKKIEANDKSLTAPKGLFKQILSSYSPAVILIDELADYCVTASGVQVGNSTLGDQTISFIQELSEAVAETDRCVVLATLPASAVEVASGQIGNTVLTALSNRLGRVGADTKPVSDEEIYEVIRRRLFESIGNENEIDNAVSGYMEMYQQFRTELPSFANKVEYKEKLKKSYPFHPELIGVFHTRWASHHYFQRTRGVLRLLASIVSDLWKRQNSLTGDNTFIHTSDVNLANLDTLSSQLKKLYGSGYDAVISADVSGSGSNAFRIDSDKKELGEYGLTQGVAVSILLASFGTSGGNRGVGFKEIKLFALRPNSFNHNSINSVLDELEGNAHYLYYTSLSETGGKRYWFHTKPNINILINQTKNEIKTPQKETEILNRIKQTTNQVNIFTVLVDPSTEIPEQTKPALVILSPEYQNNLSELTSKTCKHISKIATKKGNSERIYRNTMLFLVCSELGSAKLYSDVTEYLACRNIQSEYTSQLEPDQKDDLKGKISTLDKTIESSICTAYSILAKHVASKGVEKLDVKQFKNSLDEQINQSIIQLLKTEEWLIDSIGLGLLRKNNLIPTAETPIKTKDIYEAFIRFDDKPMISGVRAVQDSLLRYCANGEFGIASGEPGSYTKTFFKENVPFFEVTDPTYYIIDKGLCEKPEDKYQPESETWKVNNGQTQTDQPTMTDTESISESARKVKSITISGKVAVENYHQIFQSFINPLIKNNVEIRVEIKAKSTQANPITETSTQYTITKESAKQLGLRFEEEE